MIQKPGAIKCIDVGILKKLASRLQNFEEKQQGVFHVFY
jgi:hypothetical protein